MFRPIELDAAALLASDKTPLGDQFERVGLCGWRRRSMFVAARGPLTRTHPATVPRSTSPDAKRLVKELAETLSKDPNVFQTISKLRWGHGFTCPACGTGSKWHDSRGWWKCPNCGRLTSLTSDTLLHGTHVALWRWVQAAHTVAKASRRINVVSGVSAWRLQSALLLSSYETAWRVSSRLRAIMAAAVEEDRLMRHVEVGVIRVGSQEPNRLTIPGWRGWIAIAVEDRPGYWLGRVRMRSAASRRGLVAGFVSEAIVPGTPISSDGSLETTEQTIRGYSNSEEHLWAEAMRERDRIREPDRMGGPIFEVFRDGIRIAGPALLPVWPYGPVQRVCTIFNAWWRRRHRRSQAPVDLPNQLAEFSFYFNRRRWSDDRVFRNILTKMFSRDMAGLGRAKEI